MMTSRDAELDQKLLKLGLSRTVYSCYYPETQAVVDELWTSKPHALYQEAYMHRNQDLHLEFASDWVAWSSPLVQIDRLEHKHFYPSQGSSEAIRDLISQIAVARGRVHIFSGEYEGYRAYAEAFKVPVIQHQRENYQTTLKDVHRGDFFFISEPSSLDGCCWREFPDFIRYLENTCPNIQIAVDLCYIGTTTEGPLRTLESPLIHSIFFSLSKSFGVYYHRIGGVFSREAQPSLEGNNYFRNLFSLSLGKALLHAYDVTALPRKYRPLQLKTVDGIATELGELKMSDCVLLAHRPAGNETSELARYVQRQNFLRVCLTPTFETAGKR